MACPDDEQLVMLVDDELDAVGRSAVQQHLDGCTSCRSFVQEMRALTALGRSSLQSIPIPVTRRAALVAHAPARTPRMLAFASLAAAAVLLVVSLLWVVTQQEPVADRPNAPAHVANVPAITPLDHEAFERWAAQYRQKRIPLIPMEDVPKYVQPQLSPARPLPLELELPS